MDELNVVKYFGKDSFVTSVKKGFRVEQPSVMLFAGSSPQMDDVTTSIGTAPAEQDWSRLKYIGQVVRQMMMDILGLTQAAGDDPWQAATDLVQEYLEPNVYETGGPTHSAQGWTCFGQSMIDLSAFHQAVPPFFSHP